MDGRGGDRDIKVPLIIHMNMCAWKAFSSQAAETHSPVRTNTEDIFSDAEPQAHQARPNIEPPLHDIM